MDRGVALVVTLAVGALIAVQPPVNAMLARHVGDIGASFTSLAISTALVGAALVIAGQVGRLEGLSEFRPLYLLAGIGGAAVVTLTIPAVRALGAGGLAAALVSTQLIGSAILDRYGVLELERIPLTRERVLGIVLLIVGTVLVTSR
jgi:transporter family-2 protein